VAVGKRGVGLPRSGQAPSGHTRRPASEYAAEGMLDGGGTRTGLGDRLRGEAGGGERGGQEAAFHDA